MQKIWQKVTFLDSAITTDFISCYHVAINSICDYDQVMIITNQVQVAGKLSNVV